MDEAKRANSSRWLLLIALVIGLAAMVLSFAYLSKHSATAIPQKEIYVASEDLVAGSVLTRDKVKTMSLPASMSDLRAQTLTREDEGLLHQGLRLNHFIPAGQPVMYSHLIETRDIELRPDDRALTLNVKGAQALSGLLVPGDRVEVYVTRRIPRSAPPMGKAPSDPNEAILQAISQAAAAADTAGAEYVTTKVLETSVEVIAVGQQLTRSREQMVLSGASAAGSGSADGYVTIRVPSQLVKPFLEKTGGGQLTVTLVLAPKPDSAVRPQ